MIQEHDDTEANIDIFTKAIGKFNKCSFSVSFNGQHTCKLFFYRISNGSDYLATCGSCKLNTKKPTNNLNVRFN